MKAVMTIGYIMTCGCLKLHSFLDSLVNVNATFATSSLSRCRRLIILVITTIVKMSTVNYSSHYNHCKLLVELSSILM